MTSDHTSSDPATLNPAILNPATSDPATPDPAATVSLIMPVSRPDDDLRQQLKALANQDYGKAWELVISLNTDSPSERARLDEFLAQYEFASVRIVDSSDQKSAAHARNVGAAGAAGELLVFCDADDIADRGWLSAMAAALDHHDAVGGHLDETLLEIDGQQGWRPPATPRGLPTFLGQPFLVSANMGIRRQHFQESGGFDTSLIRCEDVDFSWNLLEMGLKLVYVEDAIVHYRHRRGLGPMMKQHYLYGRGFSQLLERRAVPGEEKRTGLAALKPNNQVVAKKSTAYYCRRGSIAVGRIVGLVEHRLRKT